MKIERDVLISAPVERVWSLVAEPGWWVGEDHPTGVELREGAIFVAENETDGKFPTRVEKVEPQRYIAYRWASAFPGASPDDSNSTLIEFTLTPEGDQVRLTVVETGFEKLDAPEEIRRKSLADNTGGWESELAEFMRRAEQSLR